MAKAHMSDMTQATPPPPHIIKPFLYNANHSQLLEIHFNCGESTILRRSLDRVHGDLENWVILIYYSIHIFGKYLIF